LLKAVQRVTKFELEAELARRGGEWLGVNSEDTDACFAWDPLRSVCFHFGLAKTTLGSWAWEVWGLSGPQIADRLKCAGVDKRMKDEMREAVFEYLRETDVSGRKREDVARDVWRLWKKETRGTGFNAGRAAKFGFTSYSRFGRASVLCFGVDPSELEWRAVRALVEEFFSQPVEEVLEHGAAVGGIQNSNSKIQNDGGTEAIKEGDGAQSHEDAK
jgi:hypothetical protein